MKVKRFDNLWTMGLILTGAILVLFYIAKIFFPEWIVGVAEIPSIVKFGNYVDSHKLAYYLFDSIISYLFAIVYCCACCRKKNLTYKGHLSIVVFIIILKLVSTFFPQSYTAFNYALFGFLPFVICLFENNINRQTFISSSICFVADILLQEISKFIRDIVLLSNHLNSATFFILLIDTFIWRTLFYLFFNNKIKEN